LWCRVPFQNKRNLMHWCIWVELLYKYITMHGSMNDKFILCIWFDISRYTNIQKLILIVDNIIQENNIKQITKDRTDTYQKQVQQTVQKKILSHNTICCHNTMLIWWNYFVYVFKMTLAKNNVAPWGWS